MMIINLLMIVFSCVFIIDIAGIVEQFKRWLFVFMNGKFVKYKDISLKPFSCSLCMTFWSVLFFTLFQGQGLIISVFLASISSYSSIFILWTLNYLLKKI